MITKTASASLVLSALLAHPALAQITIHDLSLQSSSHHIHLSWQITDRNTSNISSNITLNEHTVTCKNPISGCQADFDHLKDHHVYPYTITAQDSDQSRTTRYEGNIQTLPSFYTHDLSMTPTYTRAQVNWSIQSDDIDNVHSFFNINGHSYACLHNQKQCHIVATGLADGQRYSYSLISKQIPSGLTETHEGYLTTAAYPALTLSVTRLNERCSLKQCNETLQYETQGGKGPVHVIFTGASPNVIYQKQGAGETWSVDVKRKTPYDLHFTVNDSHEPPKTATADFSFTSG